VCNYWLFVSRLDEISSLRKKRIRTHKTDSTRKDVCLSKLSVLSQYIFKPNICTHRDVLWECFPQLISFNTQNSSQTFEASKTALSPSSSRCWLEWKERKSLEFCTLSRSVKTLPTFILLKSTGLTLTLRLWICVCLLVKCPLSHSHKLILFQSCKRERRPPGLL